MARYLVTGGAGFIGSHIAEALLRRGDQVRVLDNFSTGFRSNLETLSKAEVLEGDIRSYHIVREAVDGVDFVLHQAALPSVPRSVRDPLTTNEVNVVGTLNLLRAAKDAKVKRLVYASSSSVYGKNTELPKREAVAPQPISPYAVSKLAGEHYCRSFTDLYGFETVMLRYFNVFGPRQSPDSEYAAVIPRFVARMLRGQAPVIFGDGLQTRDFTFVANVVHANLLACERDRVAGQIYNIATSSPISLLQLVDAIAELIGKTVQPSFQPARAGDILHSYASIAEAHHMLGYEPQVHFMDGLRATVAHLSRDIESPARERAVAQPVGAVAT
ncbi:MAG TPA: SDR family oxidoreductase [Gemmatimonadales bacterium]|nr:SDR family oxidoreductase [Gemmatimonadales bacterium]